MPRLGGAVTLVLLVLATGAAGAPTREAPAPRAVRRESPAAGAPTREAPAPRAPSREAPAPRAGAIAPLVPNFRAAPLFGVTVDRISGLRGLLPGLRALPRRPTVRVYFDVHEPASHYSTAVARIAKVGGVMGELLDSSDERSISVAGVRARTRSYVRTLRRHVAIWEVGNEVNGNWTGSYGVVSRKLVAAYDVVAAAGDRTALTLYANDFGPDHCGDGRSELTPLQFARRWIPARIAHRLDYVLLSYYPTECGGREPSPHMVAAHLRRLRTVFPKAKLGFGEVGLPHPSRRATRARAKQIMRWAYSLDPGLPYYIGGYFWWYAAEDALRPGAPLASALRSAFKDEARALSRR